MTDHTFLLEVPLFKLLDFEEAKTLGSLLDTKHVDRGETIFRVGDHADAAYIIRSGRIEVFLENTEGEKIVLNDLGPGEVLGEVSMFDGGPRSANAVAIEDSEMLSMERDDVLEFVEKHPHAALDMLAVMAARLRKTDLILRNRAARNLNEEEQDMLTFGERVADRVATFGGSWTFIGSFGFFLFVWVLLNSWLLVRKGPFDPYPYILLNLFLSMLAALQAPVIMMSQNRQATKDRLKADLDYQINLKAELEVAQLHNKVDLIYEVVQKNFARMDKNNRQAGKVAME